MASADLLSVAVPLSVVAKYRATTVTGLVARSFGPAAATRKPQASG